MTSDPCRTGAHACPHLGGLAGPPFPASTPAGGGGGAVVAGLPGRVHAGRGPGRRGRQAAEKGKAFAWGGAPAVPLAQRVAHSFLPSFSSSLPPSFPPSQVYCSRCKAHQSGARRKEELWRLPPLLIIHLKRFQFTQQSRRKLNARVKKQYERGGGRRGRPGGVDRVRDDREMTDACRVSVP